MEQVPPGKPAAKTWLKAAIALTAASLLLLSYALFDRYCRSMDPYEAVRKLQGLKMSVVMFRLGTGRLPANIGEVILRGDLEAVPELKLKGHRRTSRIRNASSAEVLDTGGWAYVNNPASPSYGRVFIDCSHKDPKGRNWSDF